MWIVALLVLLPTARPLRLDECSSSALGMESGEIKDSQLSASSSFDQQSVGPQNSRIRTEHASGAWCPKPQIHGKSYEFLQISLEKTHIITAVETQGRFGNGTGREFATEYMIDYLRPGSKWIRYRNRTGHTHMTANSDTITSAFRSLDPPIVASKIRIVPHSKSPRTICLRAELHGCSQRDGLLYYSTVPEGSRLGEQDFRDLLFEEIDLMTETGIKRGLGLLSDGYVANGSPFDSGHPNGSWIGWNKHHTGGVLTMLFEFDQLRNFSEILFAVYGHRMDSIDVIFSQDGSNFPLSSQISSIERLAANSTEKRYDLRIPLHRRMARKVRVTIKFPGDWLFLTEVHFSSEPLIDLPEDYDVFSNQTELNETQIEEKETAPTAQKAIVIIGLCILFLLVICCLLCIMCFRRRRKEKFDYNEAERDVKKRLVTIHHEGKFVTQLQPYDFMFYGTEKTTSTRQDLSYVIRKRDFSVSTKSTSSGEKISPPTLNDIHFPPPPPWTPDDRIYAEPCMISHPTNTLPLPPKKCPTAEFKGAMTAHRIRHTQSARSPENLHYASGSLFEANVESRIEKIPHASIRFRPNSLGEGLFTVITECIVPGRGHSVYKKAKDPNNQRVRKALLDEIHTLSLCTHPNIIHLVGIDEQYGMILEYVPGGNVRNFLKKVKDVSLSKLLAICADVCSAMMHLESKGLIHGHLTPTHVLLDQKLNAKVCSARGGSHPALLRYSAPESILSDDFSTASDAWAFSVTVWEILEYCKIVPYHDLNNEALVKNAERILAGDAAAEYLIIPEMVPRGLREVLDRCFEPDPRGRPAFSTIYTFISRFHAP